MNSINRIALSFAAMVLIAVVPILLFSGAIRIPFADIPVLNGKTEETPPATEDIPSTDIPVTEPSPSTGDTPPATDTPPVTEVTPPVTDDPPVTDPPSSDVDIPMFLTEAEKFIASLGKLDENALSSGAVATDERFDKNKHTILFASFPSVTLPVDHSYGDTVREFYLRSDTEKQSLQTVTTPTPAVFPRMGFIFLSDDKGNVSLLYSDGRVIFETLPEGFSFVGARDSEDAPVFLMDGKYVRYDASENTFVSSPYDPDKDFRGIEFDYPSYYGKTNNDILRTVNSRGYWGFKKSSGSGVVGSSWKYRASYAFRDGFGLCLDSKGRLHIHNDSGTEKFTDIDLLRPEHDGIENLGYYMFEYGLMRARLVTYDSKGRILTDREVILGKNGKEYHIASDYNVVSYSDGIFLMEKDGRYGYMSHTGQWICEPRFTYAAPFIEGLGVIGYESGVKGVMDTEGNWVIDPVFHEITNCSGGVMALYDLFSGYYIVEKVNIPVTEKTE